MIPPFILVASLSAIGPQAPPSSGCAAFLWRADDRALIAMATDVPARLRLRLDGRIVDLPREGPGGEEHAGGETRLAGPISYRGEGAVAVLELKPLQDASVTDGALVSATTLRFRVGAGDETMVPVGGLIGCAAKSAGVGATK